MRKIKFRVWNKKRKSYSNDHKYDVGGDNDVVEYFASPADCFLQSLSDCQNDDNIILEQFTGLTDSKGKEIYEGDICKYSFPSYSLHESQDCIIYYEQNYCSMFISSIKGQFNCVITPTLCNDGLEIIGNINENPELI